MQGGVKPADGNRRSTDAAPSPARPQAKQADGGDKGNHDDNQPDRTEDKARQTGAHEAQAENQDEPQGRGARGQEGETKARP